MPQGGHVFRWTKFVLATFVEGHLVTVSPKLILNSDEWSQRRGLLKFD